MQKRGRGYIGTRKEKDGCHTAQLMYSFSRMIELFSLRITPLFQVLDHLVIQKLNAEGRLEKKESKKGGSMFDKVGFVFN